MRARAAWEVGDWVALAGLAERRFEDHQDQGSNPDDAKLMLLAAVGLAQLGRMKEARHYAGMARDRGCPGALVAQVLVGGVLNSLGRVASLLGENARARGYFEASIATVNPRADAGILGQARDINEKAALGLLPEAAALMQQSLNQMAAHQTIAAPQAEIFKAQMELLTGSLVLAQQRHQLSPGSAPLVTGASDPRGDAPENRASSQLGQDLWVLEQTGYKRDGFFVEFGATDGVLLSNTRLLEADYGWRGICAEPNPRFFAKLQANRTCTVAPDCIMGQSGRDVEFILADEFGGVADFADYDSHASKRAAFRETGEVITLQSISLDDFLKKYDAPRTIDYLSIDTEGSEYDILKGFPFEEWDIRLLTVEHNFTPIREDIRALLEGHGYTCTEMQWDDWYYKHPSPPADLKTDEKAGLSWQDSPRFSAPTLARLQGQSGGAGKSLSSGPFILETKSIPRSGLHFIQRTLAQVFGGGISFCEWYHEPGCCKKMPCAVTPHILSDPKSARAVLRLTKSHDFELDDPAYPPGPAQERMMLVRDPVFSLTSWWALDELQRHKDLLQEHGIPVQRIYYRHEPKVIAAARAIVDEHYKDPGAVALSVWLKAKTTYMARFAAKWAAVAKAPDQRTRLVRYDRIPAYLSDLVQRKTADFAPRQKQGCQSRLKDQLATFTISGSPFSEASSGVQAFIGLNRAAFEEAAAQLLASDEQGVFAGP